MDHFNNIIPHLEQYRSLGYVFVFVIALLESLVLVGIFIPGAAMVVFSGALASQGYFDLYGLMVVAALGAICGDGLSFQAGLRGVKLFKDDNKVFNTNYLLTGEKFFKRHAAKSIFLGRFIGVIRAVIPFIAGISRMDRKVFYFWNILSGIAWAIAHILAGYFLGEAWRMVEVWMQRIGFFFVALILVAVCAHFFRKFIIKRGHQIADFFIALLHSAQIGITGNPAISRLIESHPRVYAFLGARLTSRKFSGLPLTVLLFLALTDVLLFAGVLARVFSFDPIVILDARIDSVLYYFRDDTVLKVFSWITLLGAPRIILGLSVLFSMILLLSRRREFIVSLWVALAGSGLSVALGKMAMRRQWPIGLDFFLEPIPQSFPSTHMTIAFAFYGFVVYWVCRITRDWSARFNVVFAHFALITAIGFAQMYLGVHLFSDVIGGCLLGALWLFIGISLVEHRIFSEHFVGGLPGLSSLRKGMIAALVAAFVVFFIYTGTHYTPRYHYPDGNRATKLAGMDVLYGFKHFNLPRYAQRSSESGAAEPLDIILIAADDNAVMNAMGKTGWRRYDPDQHSSAGPNGEDDSAHILVWNGKNPDAIYIKEEPGGAGEQVKVASFWRTTLSSGADRRVYIGRIDSSSIGLSSAGLPVNHERDSLVNDLLAGKFTEYVTKRRFFDPKDARLLGSNRQPFDGFVSTIIIK